MEKKHLIIRQVQSEPSSHIEAYETLSERFIDCVCDFKELERIALTESVSGELLVLMETFDLDFKFSILREKFPHKKIVLCSKQIKPEELMKVQYERKEVDLFMKPVFKLKNLDNMLSSLTAEKTVTTTIVEKETPQQFDDNRIELKLESEEVIESSDAGEVEAGNSEKYSDSGEITLPGIELSEPISDDTSSPDDPNLGSSTFVRKLSSFTEKKEDLEQSEPGVVDLAMELEGIDSIMGVSEVGSESTVFEYNKPSVELLDVTQEVDALAVENHPKKEDDTFVSENDSLMTDSSPVVDKEASKDYLENFQQIIATKELEVEKVLLKNEVLEKENKSLIEKIIHLEDISARANLQSNEHSIEADESKIKLKVLRKRHKEEISELKLKISILNEKNNYLNEAHKKLKKNHSLVKRDQVVDTKKIESREKDLLELIEFMKKDFSSQLGHREKRVSELKRKVDLLEFDFQESSKREETYRSKIEFLEKRIYELKKFLGKSLDQLDDIEDNDFELLKKAG